MGINKVVYNGQVLIDLTSSTVTPETLVEGTIAFNSAGEQIVGTLVISTYTNLVPTSTDTDGSIYNGVGYKDNTRLSSSGGVSGSAQTGSVTTGFIPFKNTDVIRIKGAKWLNVTSGHYYFMLYDTNKAFLNAGYGYGGNHSTDTSMNSQLSVTYDEATDVTTFQIINPEGTTGGFRQAAKSAKYFRINAYGKGADLIVTVNEEIK